MEQSLDKNNFFEENFGESTFSTTELFDTLQWSILQQEVIAEIIPILSKNTELSTETINDSLIKISNVTHESLALYKLEPDLSIFKKNGIQYSDKQPDKDIFPATFSFTNNTEILKQIRSVNVIHLGKDKNTQSLHTFFYKHFDTDKNSWWIFPVQIKEHLYGLLAVLNPNMNTVNNLLFSFYKSVSLVFAQGFDRVSVIEANNEMLNRVEKANQLKTVFLTNISHEVRTPVNSIVGFSDLLADPDLTIDQREEFINMITKSSQMLVKMFDNIIDASKLKSQQLQFRKEWSDVTGILHELENEVNDNLEELLSDKVYLEVEKLSENAQIQVYTDIFRTKQILSKLIENAIEHTKEGEIKVGVKVDSKTFTFFVKDSGKGIDKENQSEIFNLFDSEEHAFTFESGGAGLGLSIAKEMSEQMGASLSFDSELNEGTIFYLSFPEKSFKVLSRGTKEKQETTKNWSDKKILVAEDVEFNYIFLREILLATGAEVIWAKNGKEACQSADENPDIDLILMDLQMPEMNGYEAAEYIKKKRPHLPIIAQTAFMMANEDEKCYKIGCDGFLSKPIRPKQLISMINKFIKT